MKRWFSIPADYTEEVRKAQDSCETLEETIFELLKNDNIYKAIDLCLKYNVSKEVFGDLLRKAYN